MFRVFVAGAQRDIAMPDDATVHDLVAWILDAVNFDDEHLYELSYRDHLGRTLKAYHPSMEEGPAADEIRIGALPLESEQDNRCRVFHENGWDHRM